MKNAISWKGLTGKTMTIEAEYTEIMAQKIQDCDGYKIEMGMVPTKAACMLTIKIDGVTVDSIWDTAFWGCIETSNKDMIAKGITHKIGDKIGVTAEMAQKINQMLKDVIAAGKAENPEVAAHYAGEAAEKAEAEIKDAREVIAKSETTPRNADGTLMTEAQANSWRRGYNAKMNEGKDGYVPEVITKEQYDRAMKVLG